MPMTTDQPASGDKPDWVEIFACLMRFSAALEAFMPQKEPPSWVLEFDRLARTILLDVELHLFSETPPPVGWVKHVMASGAASDIANEPRTPPAHLTPEQAAIWLRGYDIE
jgi:hypothetical protein